MTNQRAVKAKLVIFWDYDTQWGADRSRRYGGPKNWGSLEFENTERLLEIHEKYEIPACFAVVGAAALAGQRPYHDPVQIRRIQAAGHEIASHTLHHEWVPGLGHKRLNESLRLSKDALEQCIGAQVVSFVPPYNQPFDYPQKGSISLSERREAGKERIDLYSLCMVLAECGYRFSRVSYRLPFLRLADLLLGPWRVEYPTQAEYIAGITCIRLNTPGGFDESALLMLDRCLAKGGITTVYGHPHSLHADNSQDERYLLPFLEKAHHFQKQGLLDIVLPRELIND